MHRFDVLTIFPHILDSYTNESIIKRAIQKKCIEIHFWDIRKYSKNKHKKVDDTPYGGGAGMLMTAQPIYDCIQAVKKKNKGPVIFLTPDGKILNQTKVEKFSKLQGVILLCGRYEGIDQRIRDSLIDEEISIGKYILTGGELPAMVMIDAITRLLPGAVGDPDSIYRDSFSQGLKRKKEHPHYTKPAIFRKMKVPDILLSGNHKMIEEWREKHSK